MKDNDKLFYQPEPLQTVISWCWIILVGLLALVVQLEITTLNWISITIFIVFVLLAGWQIVSHQCIVDISRQHLILKGFIPWKYTIIKFKEIHTVTAHRFVLELQTKSKHQESIKLILTKQHCQQLNGFLSQNKGL